jgi:hypothetical protein
MGEHVFISYSNRDRAYVLELRQHMQAAGMQPWIFEHDEVPSIKYIPQLRAIIAAARAVLVVMSEQSMNSMAVLQEVHEALARQKQIIPLQLCDGIGDTTYLLRPFHWIDARFERFPLNQIARALAALEVPSLPVICLNALEPGRRYVRPSEIEVQVPLHVWAQLPKGQPAKEPICTIGAAYGSTVVIHPSLMSVSRAHAHIKIQRQQSAGWLFLIEDTSKNGTWLNGERLERYVPRPLAHNDMIALPDNVVVLHFSHYDRPTDPR